MRLILTPSILTLSVPSLTKIEVHKFQNNHLCPYWQKTSINLHSAHGDIGYDLFLPQAQEDSDITIYILLDNSICLSTILASVSPSIIDVGSKSYLCNH